MANLDLSLERSEEYVATSGSTVNLSLRVYLRRIQVLGLWLSPLWQRLLGGVDSS